MLPNTAGQEFHVIAFNSSGRVTGQAANISCQIRIDNGIRVNLTDTTPEEIGTTGEYVFTLTQAETNGHQLSFTPVCSTPGVEVFGTPGNVIYTNYAPVVSELLAQADVEELDTILTFSNNNPTTKVFVTEEDYSGQLFDFVIEKGDKSSIVEVLNISGGTDNITVSIPSIPQQDPDECFSWSIRYAGTNTVVLYGAAIYKYIAIKTILLSFALSAVSELSEVYGIGHSSNVNISRAEEIDSVNSMNYSRTTRLTSVSEIDNVNSVAAGSAHSQIWNDSDNWIDLDNWIE